MEPNSNPQFLVNRIEQELLTGQPPALQDAASDLRLLIEERPHHALEIIREINNKVQQVDQDGGGACIARQNGMIEIYDQTTGETLPAAAMPRNHGFGGQMAPYNNEAYAQTSGAEVPNANYSGSPDPVATYRQWQSRPTAGYPVAAETPQGLPNHCYEPPNLSGLDSTYAPPVLPDLSPAECQRAQKIADDLKIGDYGALQGAKYQLEGMVKDNPELAQAVIDRANYEAEQAGARNQISQSDGWIIINNPYDFNGPAVNVGLLGGAPEANWQ